MMCVLERLRKLVSGKIYIIFITDGSDPEPLWEHIYISKDVAETIRKQLYDVELARRIKLMDDAIKDSTDSHARWAYNRLHDQIKNNEYGDYNPLYEVREFKVNEE